MYKKVILTSLIGLAVFSGSSFAGANVSLHVEGGAGYAHTFFKSGVKPPESYSGAFISSGFSINPKDHYEKGFWGVYGGLVVGMNDWYFNPRYQVYFKESKRHNLSGVEVAMSPVRLSFVAGRSVYKCNRFKVNLGAGTVTHTINKGHYMDNQPGAGFTAGNESSHSLDGYTRTDALAEGQVLYALNQSTNVKFTLGYQIPVHSRVSNGALLANLGLTYNVL